MYKNTILKIKAFLLNETLSISERINLLSKDAVYRIFIHPFCSQISSEILHYTDYKFNNIVELKTKIKEIVRTIQPRPLGLHSYKDFEIAELSKIFNQIEVKRESIIDFIENLEIATTDYFYFRNIDLQEYLKVIKTLEQKFQFKICFDAFEQNSYPLKSMTMLEKNNVDYYFNETLSDLISPQFSRFYNLDKHGGNEADRIDCLENDLSCNRNCEWLILCTNEYVYFFGDWIIEFMTDKWGQIKLNECQHRV